MAKDKYPEGLAEALAALPHVQTVYVKGKEWHYLEREGCKVVSRDEVLGVQAPEAEVQMEPAAEPEAEIAPEAEVQA